MLLTAALIAFLSTCAPGVGPVTMAAIVQHESGWSAYAIGDNTTRRAYFPRSSRQATTIAEELLREGHSIDAGMAQINSGNWRKYGLNAASVFDPCTNVSVGARIINADYWGAVRMFGPGQLALWHALQAYNSGSYFAASKYANAVWADGLAISFTPRTQIARTPTPVKARIPWESLAFHPAQHVTPQTSPLLVTRRAERWSTK